MTTIDALGEHEKKVLHIASCIGKNFKYKTIAAIYENEDKLKEAISNLKKQDLIIETSTYPEREYTFGQTLVREVIYNSLLLSRRKELEEKISKLPQ